MSLIQNLTEGDIDIQAFSLFFNADAATEIPRRLNLPVQSLSHYEQYLEALKSVYTQTDGMVTVNGVNVKPVTVAVRDAIDAAILGNYKTQLEQQIASVAGGRKSYKTYAEMVAKKAEITANSIVDITNDTAENNGAYNYDGTTFTKSAYDPLTQAKSYTETAKTAAISTAATDATSKANAAQAAAIDYTNKNTMRAFDTDVDSNTILAFTDKRGAPTWLQVASDGGLTDTAKRYISAALQNSGTDIASDDYFLVVTDKADRIVAYIDADGLINGGKATAEVQGVDLTTWAFFGSSSMYYLADDAFSLLSSTFPTIKNSKIYGVSASKLGHTLANIGVNNGFVSFTGGVIDNTERATVKSGFYTNDLGVHAVSGFLENGVTGELKQDSFKATDAVSIQADADLPIRFTSNGSTHANAVALVNLGKNNVEWSDGAKTVIEGTRLAVDYLDNANDGHTIVLGHFVNNNQGTIGKDNIIKINRQLKTLYRGRYIDVQAYLMSEQVWTDIGITKTAEDIAAIANGVLPLSLGRNASHLSEAVDTQLAKQIVNLVSLKGWYL